MLTFLGRYWRVIAFAIIGSAILFTVHGCIREMARLHKSAPWADRQ